MIRRLLGKIIKLIVFVCIVLYTAIILNAALLEDICPAINNFLAAITDGISIPGVGTVGEIVVLVVGGLTLLGAFDGDDE